MRLEWSVIVDAPSYGTVYRSARVYEIVEERPLRCVARRSQIGCVATHPGPSQC